MHTLGAAEGPLAPLAGVRDTSLLQGGLACEPQLQRATHLFLRDGSNQYWRHDPRLQLLANTLEQPFNGSVSGAAPPTVAKTFLNEASCVPLELSGITSYTSAPFQLNHTMLRHFYALGERLVYYIDDLRLEEPYDISPCMRASRWRRRAGACAVESAVDTVTRETIVAAIESHSEEAGGSSEAGEVLDLELQGTLCNSANTIAAKLTVGDACWEHSHPHQLNVYDFTAWATLHPGGDTAIRQFALPPGSVALPFPSWHTMAGQWEAKLDSLIYLGRIGDTVDFQSLPEPLQLAPYAALLEAEPVFSQGFEACGSPGEVANAPIETNRYGMILTNRDTRPGDSYPIDMPTLVAEELGVTTYLEEVHSYNRDRTGGGAGAGSSRNQAARAPVGTHQPRQGKNMAWSSIVTGAEDQLRQRVAWALAQICVVSDADSQRAKEACYVCITYELGMVFMLR